VAGDLARDIRAYLDSAGGARAAGASARAAAPAPTGEAINVFISHADEDSETAARVAEILEEHGYSTWYYERDTLPGISYVTQSADGIGRSDAFLVLVSSHALASHDVAQEVEQAGAQARRFLPILAGVSAAQAQRRRPEWRSVLEAAAPVELQEKDVRPMVERLMKSLRYWNIEPKGGRTRAAKKLREPGLPNLSRVWASDANQIDIQDLKRVVFQNSIIEEFLAGRSKYFLSANKGLGKTLLLTYKRCLLNEECERQRVFLVPHQDQPLRGRDDPEI
jgi:hypothetical protein